MSRKVMGSVIMLVVVPLSVGYSQRLTPAFFFPRTSPSPASTSSPSGSGNLALQSGAAWGNPKDHRWEGVAFGGVLGALGMAVAAQVLCAHANESSGQSCFGTTIGFAALGGTVGVVLGGFIGSAIPKHPPT